MAFEVYILLKMVCICQIHLFTHNHIWVVLSSKYYSFPETESQKKIFVSHQISIFPCSWGFIPAVPLRDTRGSFFVLNHTVVRRFCSSHQKLAHNKQKQLKTRVQITLAKVMLMRETSMMINVSNKCLNALCCVFKIELTFGLFYPAPKKC